MNEKVIVNLDCLIDKSILAAFLLACGYVYQSVVVEYTGIEPDHENGGYKEVSLEQKRSVLVKQDQIIPTRLTQDEFFKLNRDVEVGPIIVTKLLELLTKNANT